MSGNLLIAAGCVSPEDHLKVKDPDADGVIGTSDPDTYDCEDGASFLTEYYADLDNDGYYSLYNSSAADFIDDLCPSEADALGYEYDTYYSEDEIDGNDYDPSITIKMDWFRDADGDGYGDAGDVVNDYEAPDGYVDNSEDDNDNDDTIYPGAPELCDGKDNDQDGSTDEGFTRPKTTVYADTDNDGYGDATGATTEACEDVVGYTTDATDCDDTNPDVNPAGTEVCNGIDDDCDTAVDSADSDITSDDTETWYRDADRDGFADVNAFNGTFTTEDYVVVQCDSPGSDWVASSLIIDVNGDGAVNDDDLDADDSDSAVKPDNAWYPDSDGDGFGDEFATSVLSNYAPSGHVADNTDWNDADGSVYPGATFYFDYDGDGFGDNTTSTSFSSDPGSGWVTVDGDWDDADPAIYPGITMYYDGDADGFGDDTNSIVASTDPGADYTVTAGDWDDTDPTIYPGVTLYYDADGDGFGDNTSATVTYTDPGANWITADGDWDDTDADIYPGVTMYYDNDGDGFGDDSTAVVAATDPGAGYVLTGGDWDDTDATMNPDTDFYIDADGDSYGDENATASFFTSDPRTGAAGGYVTNNTDFDDTNVNSYPGAPEICDGEDNDGDSSTDEGLATTTYYADADGDGDGDAATSIAACDATQAAALLGEAVVTNGDDMDDGDADLNTSTIFYTDADGDGYGDAADTTGTSGFTSYPSGYALTNDDVYDDNAYSYPGAPERFDALDTNQDGVPDSWTTADATHTVAGPSSATGLAFDLAVGDIDADGIEDVCVPDYLYSSSAGALYCVYGPVSSGTISTYGTGSDVASSNGFRISGTAGSRWGTSLAIADFNGDGNKDVITGAYYDESYKGSFNVLYGPIQSGGSRLAGSYSLSSLSLDNGTAEYTGTVDYQRIGHQLITASDIDADGDVDLGIPTQENSSYTALPQTYLFLGDTTLPSTPSFTFTGLNTGDGTTRTVFAGDLDGDGYGEILIPGTGVDVGAFNDAGTIYGIQGSATGPVTTDLSASDFTVEGESTSQALGTPLASENGCDIDGDGYSDLIYGSTGADYSATNAGAVAVHLGSVTLLSGALTPSTDADILIYGSTASDGLGNLRSSCLTNPMGTGQDAFSYAARSHTSSTGRNYLFFDLSPGTYSADDDAADTIDGATTGGQFPSAQAQGDIDGDGTPDLIFGSTSENSVYIFNLELP